MEAQTLWNAVWAVSLALSCGGFVLGLAWPLVVTSMGHNIVAADAVTWSAKY